MANLKKQCGPGYKSPLDAFINGKREKIVYIICIQPNPQTNNKPDYLAIVDVDPDSTTYSQVIFRTSVEKVGDELHHFGWNTCSSCYDDCTKSRNKIVLPALGSDRIYILDVTNDKAPKLHKTIEPNEVHVLNVSALHTTHCLPNGDVMVSTMGDAEGNGKGDFLLIDAEEGVVKETWTRGKTAKFGYDFWYQPYWDVLVSSEWGTPKDFKTGFHPEHINDIEKYGRSLNFYSWSERKLLQTIDLGTDGIAPLEIRFLHNPKASEGFVGCAVNSSVFRFFRNNDGTWDSEKVISIPKKTVKDSNGVNKVTGMITDILISLNDRYLYFSNWLHGDVRQYDITNTSKPRLVGQIFLGGSLLKGGPKTVTKDSELKDQPEPVYVKGRRLYGSPQMLQLSLDGKRLYITTSLFTPWDKQFYPEAVKNGSTLVKLDVDTIKGGLSLDQNFLVDFGKEPDGPIMAHEIRMTADRKMTDFRLQLLQEMRCQNYDMIRFASYRTACKLRYVQKKVYLHMIDIWNVIEAFRESGLNTLESHVEVNVSKFETLLSSLYHNLNKRLPTQQHVHDNLLTTILLNWIMSVYSANDTMGRIRVLSIKVALATMCSGKLMDKLRYIFSQICDQNGHMVAWKFREYLQEVLVLPSAVYESPSFHYNDQITAEIFFGNGKVTVNDFMDSMMSDPGPACLVWLPLLHRLANVENVVHPVCCDACHRDNFTGFRYRCQKCHSFQMCQECFWRGRVASGHTIEHDVKEYTSYKSPSKQIGHSLRKSFRCVPEKEKSTIPRFPEEPEKTINLSHIIPPSPLPCHNGFSELSLSSQFNTLDSKTSSRSPDRRTMSLDYTSMDDEHKLIARYAARLAVEAKVGRAPSEGSLSLDTSRAQRELIIQLESKNREIMKEITRLRKQQEIEGICSGLSVDNPALMSKLRALRNRKHELEAHLTSLQDSRRQLMVQLEGLMKLLKNHQGSPRSTPNSSPRSIKSPPPSKSAPPTPSGTLTSASSLSLMSTSDSIMVGDVRSAFSVNCQASTPASTSSLNSSTSGNRSLRNDLLVAADSVTNAMSSLVKELNSENPVNDNTTNSAIRKPLGYNKKEDDNIKVNKDVRSDSLSKSQYNKTKAQNFQADSRTSPVNIRCVPNSRSKTNSPEADSMTRWR